MKQHKENKPSTPPWEEPSEEPQHISGAEASAAAAMVPGKPDRNNINGDSGCADRNSTGGGRSARTKGQRGSDGQPVDGATAASRGRWQPSQLGYRWIVRNVGFLLFLAALAVLYIYNGHYADNISRDLNRTTKEVKDLRYEYLTLKSEVMFRSKESELAKAVAPFGLEELTRPPFVLVDTVAK